MNFTFNELPKDAILTITIKQPDIKQVYDDFYMGLTFKEWFSIDKEWYRKSQHEQIQMMWKYLDELDKDE